MSENNEGKLETLHCACNPHMRRTNCVKIDKVGKRGGMYLTVNVMDEIARTFNDESFQALRNDFFSKLDNAAESNSTAPYIMLDNGFAVLPMFDKKMHPAMLVIGADELNMFINTMGDIEE